ncbi:MAG: DUF86 domain-containing protein [Limnospira sp.]
MLSEIAVVEETVADLNFEAFSRDRQPLRVVLYSLAVIGEAVASAIADLEVAEPSIPWSQIRGMRNVVIHEYFRVEVEMIWETVRVDLPRLKAALQRIQEAEL